MILEEIARHKRGEIVCMKERLSDNPFNGNLEKSNRSFLEAIKGKSSVSLIAEIKRASPSKGLIRENLDVKYVSGLYNKYADAISVVTDELFFAGHPSLVKSAKLYSQNPVLRKDFLVDELQIKESRFLGADAVLLIASLLSADEIARFIDTASFYEMDCLVEVHNRQELEKAVSAGSKIIGINNRDLQTFKVDVSTTTKLAGLVPSEKILVSESGFSSRQEIDKMQGIADAVLVGTSLMESEDLEKKLMELSNND